MAESLRKNTTIEEQLENLTQYQSEELFLLIGSNPLPNYVVGKLLAKPGGSLYLVHTNETGVIANRLARVMNLPENGWARILVDDADAQDIFAKISKHARGKKGLGLNYTGGTKAMAVHAYRAIKEADANATNSYLDARTLELRIDTPDEAKRVRVDLLVQPSIETLLAMHGYTFQSMERHPYKPEFCQEWAKIAPETLRSWSNNNLRYGPNTPIREPKDLMTVILPTQPPFDQVQKYWGHAKTLGDLVVEWNRKIKIVDLTELAELQADNDLVAEWNGKMKIKDIAKFLDGRWLEHYTYWALQQVKVPCHIHDACLGFRPNERDFEFDVMAMRGYQLFAISCTTMGKKEEGKGKLFEAFVRARQMGGDEARVGLVCGAPNMDPIHNPARIQAEIEEEWEARGKIRVFGAGDWTDLPFRLQEWLNGQ